MDNDNKNDGNEEVVESDNKLLKEVTRLRAQLKKLEAKMTKIQQITSVDMNWSMICNAIQHEMYPHIASIITGFIRKQQIKNDDFCKQTVEKIIEKLKQRNIEIAERNYAEKLIKRAVCRESVLSNSKHSENDILFDVFSAHKIFIFGTNGFIEYSLEEFDQNIDENVNFADVCNLFPSQLIDDDMFIVFPYFFGVSFYANYLKKNLEFTNNQTIKLTAFVIPKSVSSLHDKHKKMEYSVDDVNRYMVEQDMRVLTVFRWKKDKKTTTELIKEKLQSELDASDISSEHISKLLLIIDLRPRDRSIFYIATYEENKSLNGLKNNFWIGFEFALFQKKAVCHLLYGSFNRIRFFPEFLTFFIPRLFRKPDDYSDTDWIESIYAHSFKHGWSITMNDAEFEEKYKKITKTRHVCNNYNRLLLDDEIRRDSQIMLNFVDILKNELDTNENTNHCALVDQIMNENGYDSDSFLLDTKCEQNNESNIFSDLLSTNKKEILNRVKQLVKKWTFASSEKPKKCGNKFGEEILPPHQCPIVKQVIGILQDKSLSISLSASQILTAYDHLVQIHGLCKKENELKKYIIAQIGECKDENCTFLKGHALRRREYAQNEEKKEDGDEEYGLNEIIISTLNALHTHCLHSSHTLFRLLQENGNDHFVSSETEELKTQQNGMININFGESVLVWKGNFKKQTLRECILNNPVSTITAKLFLEYAQECFLKIINDKHSMFILSEMLSIKLYTDTNVLQSKLRQSHWTNASDECRQSFFKWALTLYEAANFHSVPLPKYDETSKRPIRIYHGLNKVLIFNNYTPKYYGPTSTTTAKSVAHGFSKQMGLILNILSSYSNLWKLVLGIAVDHISHHKNESEVLLVDSVLPIAKVKNFGANIKNNVDHLLYTLKAYKKVINDPSTFYNVIGFVVDENMIKHILQHPALYDYIPSKEQNVLNRLVKELKLDHSALSERNNVFTCTELKIAQTPKSVLCRVHSTNENAKTCKYKVLDNEFEYADECILDKTECKKYEHLDVMIKNEKLSNQYLILQKFPLPMFDDTKFVMAYPFIQCANENFVGCKFAVIWNSESNEKKQSIQTELPLLIPFNKNNGKILSVYIQPNDFVNFHLFQQFDVDQTAQSECEYFLFVLEQMQKKRMNVSSNIFSKLCIKWNDEWIQKINKMIISRNDSKDILNMLISQIGIKEFEIFAHVLQTDIFSFSHLFNYYSFGANIEKCKDVKIKINELTSLYVCGSGSCGRLGISDFYNKYCVKPMRLQTVNGILDVAASKEHTMMIGHDGCIWTFGCGEDGRLGIGNTENVKVPQQIHLNHRAITVCVGGKHSIILTESGAVLSCGDNALGQLGHGDTKNRFTPKVVEALKNHKITQISAGKYHNGALSEKGHLFMWGLNYSGQCGVGKDGRKNIKTPTKIKLKEKVSAIECGHIHSLVITIKHLLYSFGSGDHGRLGHGSSKNKLFPALINGLKERKIVKVVGGFAHTLCIDDAFNVWGFGNNKSGQCGHSNSVKHQPTPKKIKYFTANKIKAKEVAAGHCSSCVISQNNECFVFGNNENYQIGLKEKKNCFVPTKLPLHVQKVSMADEYSTFIVGTCNEFILHNGKQKNAKNPGSNSFNISLQSQSIFGDSNWYILKNVFFDSSSSFINGLQFKQNEFICFDAQTEIDEICLSQFIGCEFLLLLTNKNEKRFELNESDLKNAKYGKDNIKIYSFAKEDNLKNIKWKVPKTKKYEIINVYVRAASRSKYFIHLKSFPLSNAINID